MQVYRVGHLEIELALPHLKPLGGSLLVGSFLALALVCGWPFLKGARSGSLTASLSLVAAPQRRGAEDASLVHARRLPAPEPTPTPMPFSVPVVYTVQPERLLTFTGTWHPGEVTSAQKAVTDVALSLAETFAAQGNPRPPTEAFLQVFGGPVEFRRVGETCTESRAARGISLVCGDSIWGETLSPNLVLVFAPTTPTQLITHPRWFVHELGHAFSQATGGAPEISVSPNWPRDKLFAGPLNVWQFSSSPTQNELFADLFLAWVYATWGPAPDGSAFMADNMPRWLQESIHNSP